MVNNTKSSYKKSISILGSTGSIGTQTLDVIRHNLDLFDVNCLSMGTNIDLIKQQILEFSPEIVSVGTQEFVSEVETFISENGLATQVLFGDEGLNAVATHSKNDFLVVSIEGSRALNPTYLAISQGINIGLASKEILVAAGSIIMSHAKKHNVTIVPIDSEHVAIKQCLARVNEDINLVKKTILTASGGPFRDYNKDQLNNVTVEQALKHPNWSMGPKITIDSATMMNKGLEVIEAHHLFGIDFDDIDVLVHPQSIVHGMVLFKDGNVISQMGPPDMRFPIQYALSYPQMIDYKWPELDFSSFSSLTFSEPNYVCFPLLKMAYDVGRKGGAYPVVFNAANEIAVHRFLSHKISFLDIYTMVYEAYCHEPFLPNPSLDDIIQTDHSLKERLMHVC